MLAGKAKPQGCHAPSSFMKATGGHGSQTRPLPHCRRAGFPFGRSKLSLAASRNIKQTASGAGGPSHTLIAGIRCGAPDAGCGRKSSLAAISSSTTVKACSKRTWPRILSRPPS
jgi:hypothetical protein